MTANVQIARVSVCFALLLAVLAVPIRALADDVDGDGVDDATENYLAARFIPPIYASWTDGCLSPLNPKPAVFRARHPDVWGTIYNDYIAINYVLLYDDDCGFFSSHIGDAESFLVFLHWNGSDWAFDSESATAHWDDTCEDWTASVNPGLVVGANKHGTYTNSSQCGCFGDDGCNDSTYQMDVALYNAGEPSYPNSMTNDLGAIKADWSGHYVWSGDFYGAGPISPMMYLTRYDIVTYVPEYAPCTGQCGQTYQECSNSCIGDQWCEAQCESDEANCGQSCYASWHWNGQT